MALFSIKKRDQSTQKPVEDSVKPEKKIEVEPKKQTSAPEKNLLELYEHRKDIFEETLHACTHGYINPKNRVIQINNKPMLTETVKYSSVDPLPRAAALFKTQFSVVTSDTLVALRNRAKKGDTPPCGINMANSYHPGGGVKEGMPAQEEAICRSSNHYLGLRSQEYPLDPYGGIYVPHSLIFRDNEASNFAFLEEPVEVALVAVAAYDLRKTSCDRLPLGFSSEEEISSSQLSQNKLYLQGMKEKIRNMLRMMALKGHTHIVLGALGCGAFQNPPEVVASLFAEVFKEEELANRFETVDFAILKIFPKDQNNIDIFTALCAKLNG